jgi:hypothetical protein
MEEITHHACDVCVAGELAVSPAQIALVMRSSSAPNSSFVILQFLH